MRSGCFLFHGCIPIIRQAVNAVVSQTAALLFSTLCPFTKSYSCLQEPSLSICCWLSCSERISCLANINDCELSPVGACLGRDACLYSKTLSHYFIEDNFSLSGVWILSNSNVFILSEVECSLYDPSLPQEISFSAVKSVIFYIFTFLFTFIRWPYLVSDVTGTSHQAPFSVLWV